MRRRSGPNHTRHKLLAPVPIGLLILAGCSTTSIADLQQREPSAVIPSSRAPADISRCLVEQLGHLGAPNVYQRGEATVIGFTVEGDTTALFTIEAGRVEVRMLSRIIPYRKKSEVCF